MAEFDLEELLNLSKVKIFLDLSKVFPIKAFSLLAAFLPGLFFEISILLASPELISRLAARQGFVVGQYVIIAVVLFLAFAIGNAFMLVDSLIQYVLSYLYRFRVFCWRQFCKWPLKPILEWAIRKPRWVRHHWVVRFHQYVIYTGYLGSDEWQKLWRCWLVFAQQLVSVRYGIKPEDLHGEEWEVLYWTLGSPTAEEIRGDLVMNASHAMGWAGLFASRIAPALENKYYLAFCVFLIINGLLHDYYAVKKRVDPRISGYLNVRAILRAFPDNLRKNVRSSDADPLQT